MEKIIKTAWFFVVLISLSLSAFLFLGTIPVWANVSSLNFDGSNDYVNVGNDASLNVGNKITIEAWTKFRNPAAINRNIIFATRTTSSPTGSFAFDAGTFGLGQVRLSTPGIWNVISENNVTSQQDVWKHVAYTRDQSASGSFTQKVYVNGNAVRLATDDPIAFVDNTLPKYIGIASCCGTYNGLIDEVRLWNYPRTQDEIQRDMRKELSGTESGLVGYWKFDENDGGCWTRDSTANGNHGQLVSNASTTCALSGASGDRAGFSTDIPALNGDLPKVINSQITNSAHYKGEATSQKGFTVKAFEYSLNGSGWSGIQPVDGQYDEDHEDFEFDFKQEANGNPYPGYVLETQATDSGWRKSKTLHFAPFNLKSVTKIDNQLEFTLEINKQRNLLKDKLSHFKIEYSTDGTNYQKLLDEIPADFEQVRSSLRNLASHNQPNCDPCLFEDSTMYVSYSDNNSLLRIKTKEEFTKANLTLRALALNFDGNSQQSDTISPEDKTKTRNILTSQSSTPEVTSAAKVQGEQTKSLPGQKTTFETPSGAQTGPIAAIINGVITTVLGIWEKVGTILNFKL